MSEASAKFPLVKTAAALETAGPNWASLHFHSLTKALDRFQDLASFFTAFFSEGRGAFGACCQPSTLATEATEAERSKVGFESVPMDSLLAAAGWPAASSAQISHAVHATNPAAVPRCTKVQTRQQLSAICPPSNRRSTGILAAIWSFRPLAGRLSSIARPPSCPAGPNEFCMAQHSRSYLLGEQIGGALLAAAKLTPTIDADRPVRFRPAAAICRNAAGAVRRATDAQPGPIRWTTR